MCLEEEISSLTEDGLITQISPVDIGKEIPYKILIRAAFIDLLEDNSEDPILTRAVGRPSESAAGCPFDSSQESSPLGDASKLSKKHHHQQVEGSYHATLRPRDSSPRPHDSALGPCSSYPRPRGSSPGPHDSPRPQESSPIPCNSSPGRPRDSTVKEESDSNKSTSSETTQTAFQVADSAIQVNRLSPEGVQELPITSTTIATQTEGNSELVASVLSALEPKEMLANGSLEKAVQNSLSTTFRPLSTDPVMKELEWSATSENLTVGLELHRIKSSSSSGEKENMFIVSASTCEDSKNSIAVQVSEADIPESTVPPFAAIQSAGCVPPDCKEAEILRERVQELEEKLLSAESTALWQSLVIRLYQQDDS